MTIKVDSEQTKQIIVQLVDVALKAGGVNNLQAAMSILNSLVVEEDKKEDGKA